MYMLKAVYPTGSHIITDSKGIRLVFNSIDEAKQVLVNIPCAHRVIIVENQI